MSRRSGIEIDTALLLRGARALRSCRYDDGIFSYGHPRRRSPVESSAGRMPLCEYGLFLNRMSKPADVRAAIDKAFEHHGLRERVRKYDDHADRWGNGGFFFYYDLFGISHAADALPKSDREKVQTRLRTIVLSIGEIDGSWQDSHELGKMYGT